MSKKSDQSTSQSKRFLEKARELGCDESEELFKEALRKIAKAKRPKPKDLEKGHDGKGD